jgi:hypothetical protein
MLESTVRFEYPPTRQFDRVPRHDPTDNRRAIPDSLYKFPGDSIRHTEH